MITPMLRHPMRFALLIQIGVLIVCLLPSHVRAIEGILFYGQSNAGAGGRDSARLVQPVFPRSVLSFKSANQSYGDRRVGPEELSGVGVLSDNVKYAAFPATAMAYALARGEPKESSRRFFFYTVWLGGQSLDRFFPGSIPWANLMAAAGQMPMVLSESAQVGAISALVLIQGESGPSGVQRYGELLNRFLDLALEGLQKQSQQQRRPIAIVLQTNAIDGQSHTSTGVSMAQDNVALSRPADTVLAGPTYQFPLADKAHLTSEGRMMQGDLLAQVYRSRVIANEPFRPLRPIAAQRESNRVIVTFERPQAAAALEWDLSWISPAPNFGFALSSEKGVIPIESVAITGPSEVTISFKDQIQVGAMVVKYAMDQTQISGWASGRGQLVAPTAVASAFATLGAKVPGRISHYCIRFELPVRLMTKLH